MAEQILFYERFGYFLSNFSSFSIYWQGSQWMSVEHAYQSAKFEDETIVEKIRLSPSSHEAKQLAQLHKDAIRKGWDAERLQVMKELLRAKVQQHKFVREQLLKTKDSLLVEDSPVDGFWGRGSDWQGHNHLGRIWMELRDEVRLQRFASDF